MFVFHTRKFRCLHEQMSKTSLIDFQRKNANEIACKFFQQIMIFILHILIHMFIAQEFQVFINMIKRMRSTALVRIVNNKLLLLSVFFVKNARGK